MATRKDDLDTPALIVDIDKLRFNIDDMASFAAANSIVLRPHAKTHKTPQIGKLQMEAGAVGLTVAKLSEAEVFIDAGCSEILVAYPLVGSTKHRRLVELCERAHISTVVDHIDIAEALSTSMSAAGIDLPVMVEVDTGLSRCGVAPGEPARDLAQLIDRLPGLRFAGLLTHEGHAQLAGAPDQVRATGLSAGEMMAETAELIRKSGLEVPIISVGLTATAKITATVDGVTETRPGIYVFYDRSEVLHQVVTARALCRPRIDDGGDAPGSRPHHSRCRHQSADQRSRRGVAAGGRAWHCARSSGLGNPKFERGTRRHSGAARRSCSNRRAGRGHSQSYLPGDQSLRQHVYHAGRSRY